eukprot:s473_g7.t1
MSETSGGEKGSGVVPKELASLVPGFDPAVDNVEIWTSKVELLLTTWPTDKLNELATRLILGCKGTAYQKLQLLRAEVLTGDAKGIQRLVEIVGGTWGQIPLEKKFELAEKALFRSAQRADETSDSYLSRCDVTWTELLAKKVDLKELQAYIVLRGSKLGAEDKKRVIVETKAEQGKQLTMESVTSAIRLLGSGFFQEYTGGRREKGAKTYDHTAFHADEEWETEHDTYVTQEDYPDDDILETLAAENDEDAILVMQFEDSIAETIQSDSEPSAYYSTYQDARRRLSEHVKVRGFWPVSKRFDKGGKKGKGKSKGKNPFSGPGSLARRIANSFCRICMQKGHWKNERPQRQQATGSQNTAGTATSIPTSFVVADEVSSEFAHLAVDDSQDPQGLIPVIHHIGVLMSSISQKLQVFRESQKKDSDQDELTKIQNMTLQELKGEKIGFGKAKMGMPFPEAFKDGPWTDWFVSTYEKSTKPAHQTYIRYVELRLNEEIKTDAWIKKATKDQKPTIKSDAAKAAEEMAKAVETASWDEMSEPDVSQEFVIPGMTKLHQVEDQVSSLELQNLNMANRMTQVEMALQELLQHVRGLSVKSEP